MKLDRERQIQTIRACARIWRDQEAMSTNLRDRERARISAERFEAKAARMEASSARRLGFQLFGWVMGVCLIVGLIAR